MKALFAAIAIGFLLSCNTSSHLNRPERMETAILFENGLAYDGCQEFIQLLSDTTQYRPTTASLPILQRALMDIPLDTTTHTQTALVSFIETGQLATLQCGWGVTRRLPEIEIISITRR